MKKYIFTNANFELTKINNDIKDDDIPLSKFSRIILIVFSFIFSINQITMWCESSYINYLYEHMQNNFILSELLKFLIEITGVTESTFEDKKNIVAFTSFLIYVFSISPFFVEVYINENQIKLGKKLND